jgi:hypothetical protein
MYLHEAIRWGALTRPQAFMSGPIEKGSCALQAAEDADGLSVEQLVNAARTE